MGTQWCGPGHWVSGLWVSKVLKHSSQLHLARGRVNVITSVFSSSRKYLQYCDYDVGKFIFERKHTFAYGDWIIDGADVGSYL